MYYQSTRSINKKINQQKTQIPHCMYDVIKFTEIWLTFNITTSELGLKGYLNYRCDRIRNTSSLTK